MASSRQPNLAHQRHDRIERCWLCGIALPTAQFVPDGGSGCTDVRWYCRDVRACTRRWTSIARPSAVSNASTAKPSAASTAKPSAADPSTAAASTTSGQAP